MLSLSAWLVSLRSTRESPKSAILATKPRRSLRERASSTLAGCSSGQDRFIIRDMWVMNDDTWQVQELAGWWGRSQGVSIGRSRCVEAGGTHAHTRPHTYT